MQTLTLILTQMLTLTLTLTLKITLNLTLPYGDHKSMTENRDTFQLALGRPRVWPASGSANPTTFQI